MNILTLLSLALIMRALMIALASKKVKSRLWQWRRKFTYFLSQDYVDSRNLFFYLYGKIPSISFVSGVDLTSVLNYLQQEYAEQIVDIHQSEYYDRDDEKCYLKSMIVVMKNNLMVELSREYAELLYNGHSVEDMRTMTATLAAMKAQEKQKDFEINVIINEHGDLYLKGLDITPTALDIDLYYNDDFKEVHEYMVQRLSQQKDKGIVLLHGLPGTGKTTYLRHLIGCIKKRILFVSPDVAELLTSPSFIELLIDNPNSVLIIEDAENIIMDRKVNSNSSVSNLLNMSDGLLSDCLNVQIVCTFNSQLSAIDQALLRKGRLIAQYEFDKLQVAKARALAKAKGVQAPIDEPLTLSEVIHADTKCFETKKHKPIGFNRLLELVETE